MAFQACLFAWLTIILAILPNLRGQPVRAYPLRPINEPAMYVAGENMGRKAPVQSQGHPGRPTGHPMGATPGMAALAGMGGGIQHQAAMLAHQNREMAEMDRRQARDRMSGMPAHTVSQTEQQYCFSALRLNIAS